MVIKEGCPLVVLPVFLAITGDGSFKWKAEMSLAGLQLRICSPFEAQSGTGVPAHIHIRLPEPPTAPNTI